MGDQYIILSLEIFAFPIVIKYIIKENKEWFPISLREKNQSVHWPNLILPHYLSALISSYSPPCPLLTGLLAVPGTCQGLSCLSAFAQAVLLLGILLCHGLNLLRCSPLSESILTIPLKFLHLHLLLRMPPSQLLVTYSYHLTPCITIYLLLFPLPQQTVNAIKTEILA